MTDMSKLTAYQRAVLLVANATPNSRDTLNALAGRSTFAGQKSQLEDLVERDLLARHSIPRGYGYTITDAGEDAAELIHEAQYPELYAARKRSEARQRRLELRDAYLQKLQGQVRP